MVAWSKGHKATWPHSHRVTLSQDYMAMLQEVRRSDGQMIALSPGPMATWSHGWRIRGSRVPGSHSHIVEGGLQLYIQIITWLYERTPT